MKITRTRLRRIIKEELNRALLSEQGDPPPIETLPTGTLSDPGDRVYSDSDVEEIETPKTEAEANNLLFSALDAIIVQIASDMGSEDVSKELPTAGKNIEYDITLTISKDTDPVIKSLSAVGSLPEDSEITDIVRNVIDDFLKTDPTIRAGLRWYAEDDYGEIPLEIKLSTIGYDPAEEQRH